MKKRMLIMFAWICLFDLVFFGFIFLRGCTYSSEVFDDKTRQKISGVKIAVAKKIGDFVQNKVIDTLDRIDLNPIIGTVAGLFGLGGLFVNRKRKQEKAKVDEKREINKEFLAKLTDKQKADYNTTENEVRNRKKKK